MRSVAIFFILASANFALGQDNSKARNDGYYYDLSLSAREHRSFRNVFAMTRTGLKYTASIKHYDNWEHLALKYHDVYIADLNLEWSSVCGGLCGIGFTRNKLVVLDSKGEVIEMFIDAAVNRSMWVS